MSFGTKSEALEEKATYLSLPEIAVQLESPSPPNLTISEGKTARALFIGPIRKTHIKDKPNPTAKIAAFFIILNLGCFFVSAILKIYQNKGKLPICY
jgi:hypothetical protein